MKDRQVEQTFVQQRIPIVSAVLHCVAMTALVFLRSGFGYAYLRPKSIFLASSWACLLFSIYAWNEPAVWASNSGLCIFGCAGALLYMAHLFISFVSELRDNATHDHDSGTPHILRLMSLLNMHPSTEFRSRMVMVAEPGIVFATALILGRLGLGMKNLSAWLHLAALCMFLKELINHWLQLRQRKRQRDAIDDAREGIDSIHTNQSELPTANRRPKVRRPRAH